LRKDRVAGCRVAGLSNRGLWYFPGAEGASMSQILCAAAPGDEVRIWNVTTGVERHLAYTVGGFGSRGALAISSDARWLAVDDADMIGVFDLSSGDLRWEVRMPSRPDILPDIAAMAFSPDGKTLYTADFRLRLSAWRLE
jgi:hypothetical protein